MNIKPVIFIALGIMATGSVGAATCSRANLTRCLDSVCAINIGSNPSARCQYCGTPDAGTPPTKGGMRSVSVGQSSNYTISDKELKNAPTDPVTRYAWAQTQCLAKLTACTADDVADNYDKLISQSCTAAGVAAQYSQLAVAAKVVKDQATCETQMQACIIQEKRCGGNYAGCVDGVVFDRNLSECAVSDATGCDEFMQGIRTTLLANRDTAIQNAETVLNQIAASYQKKRTEEWAVVQSDCQGTKGRDRCVEQVCSTNMPHQCADGYAAERASAVLMCKYMELACNTVRK